MKARVTLFTLAIFLLSIWALSFYAARMLQSDMQHVLGEQQFSTASFIAAQVEDELGDRLAALERIAKLVDARLMADPAALQADLEQRPNLQALFNGGTIAYRMDGTAIADIPRAAGRLGINYMDVDTVARALTQGTPNIGRPLMGKKLGAPVFGITVPIRDARGTIIGALAGVTNLGLPNFLNQVTRNTYGKTGGYFVVAREHRLVVAASDRSRIMETLPAPGISAASDRALQDDVVAAVYVNPRGEEVLASSKGIPVANWYVGVAMPVAEAFAPIHAMQQRMLFATLVLTLLAGGLTWWMLRHQLAPMLATVKALARLSDTEQPAQALPITSQDEIGDLIGGFNRLLQALGRRESALRDSEENLAITLNSIGDAVISTDPAGRVTGMNPAAEHLCGWSMDEARGRSLVEVFRIVNAVTRVVVADPVQQVMSSGTVVGLANHTVLLAKDGQEYQIADSAAPIRNAAGNIMGVVLVFSDVTERYRAEAALIDSEERWKFAIEGVGDGLWDWNMQTGVAFYSHRYKEMLGFADAEIGESADEWTQRIHPEDAPGVMAALQPYVDGKAGSATVEFRMRCKDGSWLWALGRGMVVSRDAHGKALRMIGTNSDITERKQSAMVDRFLSHAGNGAGAEPFFEALARFLAESLQMDYICIDRLDGEALNATTLAVWHDGHFEDNLTYALSDTPCAEVVGNNVCCYPASVCKLFPNDAALQELRAESYIGVTLWNHAGKPIGLIAVIGRRVLANRALAEATLTRVAVRAAAELERLSSEAALRESETRLRTVVDSTREAIAVHQNGKVIFVNPAAMQMMGAEGAHELLGKTILDFVHPDFRQMVLERIRGQIDNGLDMPLVEEKFIRLDGVTIDVEVQASPIVYRGHPAIQVAMRDITERKQARAILLLSASVFEHAREGIIITQADGSIIDVNEAFTRITGYSRQDAIGQNPRMLNSGRQEPGFYAAMWKTLGDQGHWSGEVWNRRKDGEVFAELLTISAVRGPDGNPQHYVALFSDITAIKDHQSKLDRMAHFDALTSLPNRLLLADRLQQGLAQAARRGQTLAVAYLDLDGFKAVNDRHGHDVGDQLLIDLAGRMKQTLREGDTLARIGGDEFVAVLTDLADAQACAPLLTRLLLAAAQPVPIAASGMQVQVSASLGVTFYPQAQDIDADQLLRQADQAMYQAKVAGKNRYHVFDAEQDSSIRGHHESLERIRLGLQNREFVLYYQPKVNMRTGQVTGAEALIRWQHPEKGLLPPAAFLPVIEDHPLAISVGEWVIDTALTQMALWHADGLKMPVSVNIGARQLQQSDFVDRLRSILAAHPNVPAHCLELEVLETSALEDIAQVSQVIEACAQMDVTFALDDFGTGYSSLTYLKRLHVAMLKIDQSFVRDMLDDADDLAILQGVIGLAVAFKRDVIAEGVESIAHGSLLLQLGCELAQGYGIARPMPADAMPAWAAAWRPDAAWDALPDIAAKAMTSPG